jgi:hypothetical protein
LFESALIVFSVLLALLLNEWRDARRQGALSETARAAIVAELERNRDIAERARQNHLKINKTLTDLAARGEKVTVEVASSGLFNPANLVDTAWTSAQQTGAVDRWSFDSVLLVASVYERQAGYVELGRAIGADMYMDLRRRGLESVMEDGPAGIILLTQDFATREKNLVSSYDAALTTIRTQDR